MIPIPAEHALHPIPKMPPPLWVMAQRAGTMHLHLTTVGLNIRLVYHIQAIAITQI